MLLRSLILLGILAGFSQVSLASLTDSHLALESDKKVDLSRYLKFYQTSELDLDPQEFFEEDSQGKFQPPPGGKISFGYSNDDIWLRIKVRNEGTELLRKHLELGYPVLDLVDLYVFENGERIQSYHTGDTVPFENRPLNTRNFVFPLEIPADTEQVLFFRIHSKSALFVPFTLWDPDEFSYTDDLATMVQGLYFGSMLVMVAYNIFVFLAIKHRSYLFYALFVLSITIFQGTLHGFGYKYFWGGLDWINAKGVTLFVCFTALFGSLFCIDFLQLKKVSKISYRVVWGISIISMIFAVMSLVLPDNVAVRFTTPLALLSPIPVIVIGTIQTLKGHTSARIFTLAWTAFLFGTIALALSRYGIIPKSIFSEYGQQIGSTIEVVLLSLAMANKLDELKKQLQVANNSLQLHIENVEQIVAEKTTKIRSILKNIRQGIFSVGENLTTDEECSDYLLDMIGMKTVKGKSLDEVFLTSCKFTSDEKSQIRSSLDLGIGSDIFTFEGNADLLKTEVTYEKGPGDERIIELDWDPITNAEDEVERVLVCVRDVTELKELEKLNMERQRELEYIGEILSVQEITFAKFIKGAKEFVNENLRLVDGIRNFDPEILKVLFLNMHTLKGTSRGYGFRHLTTLIHDTEQSYVQMRNREAVWDLTTIVKDLNEIMRVIEYYEDINVNKLGRISKDRQVIVEMEEIEELLENINDINSTNSNVANLAKARLEQKIKSMYYTPAKDVLSEIFKGSDRLAVDLNKNKPDIRINKCMFGINETYEELFKRVFVHLLRNSMFHGIEDPEVRSSKGKSSSGLISVDFQLVGPNMQIIYRDDGQGLDIDSIKSKAAGLGIEVSELASKQELANLIFTPGITTAKIENDISGRGVGMDAIQKFIEDHDGSVELKLTGENQENHFINFEVVMILPPPHFSPIGSIEDRLAS